MHGLSPDLFDFSIIIPVHDKCELTQQCLEGIEATAMPHRVEVIVIDNASSDDTPDYLRALGDRIRLITNDRNESYSLANNQGARIARGRYLILLNNDTLPLPGWLDALVAGFEDPTVGIQGAKLRYGNDSIQHAGMVFGARPGRREEPYHAYLCADPSAPFVNRRRDVQFVTGACLAIPRDLYERLGGLDEEYIYGWEDTDLCMKVLDAGHRVIYNPDVELYHFESLTKKLQDSQGHAYLNNEAPHEQRNRARFMAKWDLKIRRDATDFYAEDGFLLQEGRLIPSRSVLVPNLLTSFARRFWERGYDKASRALVRCNGAIGDALTTTSIVTALQQQYPHLEIHVSGDERVEWVFRHLPAMRGFMAKDSTEEKALMAEPGLVVVDYHDIIGRCADFYNGIGYMDVLANIAGVQLGDRQLHYQVEPDEAAWAQAECSAFGCGPLTIGLQFHTGKDVKRSYPHGAALVRLLAERYPEARFVLFGQEPLDITHPAVYDCADREVPFRQQMALAHRCDAFVTIDSAFFHIGHNLCRKPTLTLFGVTNPLLSGNPEAGFYTVQNRKLNCLSCYWQTPCNIECMGGLEPQDVVEAFSRMLSGDPALRVPLSPAVEKLKLPPAAEPETWLVAQMRQRRTPARFELVDPGHRLPSDARQWNGLSVVPQAPLNVVWEGSQLVRHSLALINRELCLRLMDQGHEVTIVPYEQDEFGPEADPRVQRLVDRTMAPLSLPADVHVRHQWPPYFNPPPSGCWVMIQPWEFGGAPAEWVGPMRDMVDEVWVPSRHVRDGYIRSGIPGEKVHVIPNGVDTDRMRPEAPPFPLKTRKRFKFLFVGGTIHRKGIDILLDTYFQTFTAQDDVCLVIKDMGGKTFYKGQTAQEMIARYQTDPQAPEIEYLDQPLSDDEIAGIYTACDALVHPYRGEGFGLPIAEAMACGLPVIVTGYGACLDFCDQETAYLVPAREVPIGQSALPPSAVGYWWAEPDRAALARLMQDVAANPEAAREVGKRARARIVTDFGWDKMASRVEQRLRALAMRTPIRAMAPDPFRPNLSPLPLADRKGRAFFHHPQWKSEAWKQVLVQFASSFQATDDVCMVLWLDPSQGVSEEEAGELILAALGDAGLDPDHVPDLLLVPDALDLPGLARLYAAVDCVVPGGDSLQEERAHKVGIRVLTDLAPERWHTVTILQSTRPSARN